MILRDELVEAVKKEIIGPSPGSANEHEIINESPLVRYITGVMEPIQDLVEVESLDEEDEDDIEDVDEVTKTSNLTAVSQSSFGYSFFIDAASKHPLTVNITYGVYSKQEDGSFKRTPFKATFTFDLGRINLNSPGRVKLHENKLLLSLHERDASNRFFDFSGRRLFTVSIMNLLKKEKNERSAIDDCFFQVQLATTTHQDEPFLPYPEYVSSKSEDDSINQLLYRDVRNYSNGHGCSVSWDVNNTANVTGLVSAFIPEYELFPLNHRELDGLELKMVNFFNDKDNTYTTKTISLLIHEYEKWIRENEESIGSIKPVALQKQAKENVLRCRAVLKRMEKGMELLKGSEVSTAFRYMNWAMSFQQIRYGLEDRQWTFDGSQLTIDQVKLPEVEDSSTWNDYDAVSGKNKKLGKWRPFQLAFVLMNLGAISEEQSVDRETVDLIWFPTGGGKTEAYLGLTAFTILYNRLTGKKSQGTEVIMRYTLRLLTTEQFQRAASLICACDLLRSKVDGLGANPISIGLWVGGDVTPNRAKQALDTYQAMIDTNGPYKFVLLKCPCCGKRMGKIKAGNHSEVKGLRLLNERIDFMCYGDCEYAGSKLPIEVVDDYIYEDPCTLVIATVDKFAQLPWEPRSRKILGVDCPVAGASNPPTLVIQDELHLISGPLGSMVGLYETLVDYLVTSGTSKVKPKIIASTATIALAKEQIKALYARGVDQICVFPTPCINHNDNFFAFLDTSAPGRKYVGVYANNSSSFKTTQVKVMSILLQAPYMFKTTHNSEIDPYFTLVTYFNRTKDLAYAVTFCDDDIIKRLREIQHQYNIPKDDRRYLNHYEELTSRVKNEQIPQIRQKMAISYPNSKALDVCLATNMISVGIDIPRLSLMCMVAQPKSTAEYIQASSRVGRDRSKPGVVFMVYNAKRSRDRSHFEKFLSYHNKIYSYVEASGVTPFSLPAVERGLAGVIVGMLRLKENIGGDFSSVRMPPNAVINKIRSFILDRCHFVDPVEVPRVEKYFDSLIEKWRQINPTFYGEYKPDYNGPAPLMVPFAADENSNWDPEPWRVLQSLRNVDKEISLKQFQSLAND